jgi:hypothetical protein
MGLRTMNKSDVKLIVMVLFITVIAFIYLNMNSSAGDYAIVYYENKAIKKINLNVDSEYVVKGYNGDVKISVKSNSIAVIEEDSPKHLCSKQGYVNNSLEPIICLPNKIVIKIEKENNEVDTVVR